jgi:hypothetical protein
MPRSDEQQVIEEAVIANYSARRSARRINLGINGRTIAYDPKYYGMKYPGFETAGMLGNPEAMLKNPMPGAKYVWKTRSGDLGKSLAGLIRQDVLRPVEVDEVNPKHPYALFQRLVLAGKPVVAWESHILCEMPPAEADRRINCWEQYAISQVIGARDQWARDVEEVSHGQMIGEFTASNPGPA